MTDCVLDHAAVEPSFNANGADSATIPDVHTDWFTGFHDDR